MAGRIEPVLTKENQNYDVENQSNDFVYKTGIPTLRSSAHRVKYSPKHRRVNDNQGCCLPHLLCQPLLLDYDFTKYDFQNVLLQVLEECKTQTIGHCSSSSLKRLEDWKVPPQSVTRKHHGGTCEDSQAYLSDQLATSTEFLFLFDNFVENVVLPHLKEQLLSLHSDGEPMVKGTTFYYQRPPTLRLQPGPARAHVKMHNDAQYGHQDGEVNFWLPLTDRSLTKVDLHLEQEDGICTPMQVAVGQVLQFHGTRVNHYVNSNVTPYTRVSMDFRIGVEGYFDPQWAMVGTTADHSRRKVQI